MHEASSCRTCCALLATGSVFAADKTTGAGCALIAGGVLIGFSSLKGSKKTLDIFCSARNLRTERCYQYVDIIKQRTALTRKISLNFTRDCERHQQEPKVKEVFDNMPMMRQYLTLMDELLGLLARPGQGRGHCPESRSDSSVTIPFGREPRGERNGLTLEISTLMTDESADRPSVLTPKGEEND